MKQKKVSISKLFSFAAKTPSHYQRKWRQRRKMLIKGGKFTKIFTE